MVESEITYKSAPAGGMSHVMKMERFNPEIEKIDFGVIADVGSTHFPEETLGPVRHRNRGKGKM